MRKLTSIMAVLALFGGIAVAHAENSATAGDSTYRSQQVFVSAYNNSASTISRDNVVALDTAGTAGSTLGGYINTTTTTDSVYIFGVTDEDIAAGTMGRVAVRGPHKVVLAAVPSGAGTVYSSCTSNAGKACPFTTSAGTAGGILGVVLNATATTDTGDAAKTYWMWLQPHTNK